MTLSGPLATATSTSAGTPTNPGDLP